MIEQILITDDALLERLTGLQTSEFEPLYRDFSVAWEMAEAERRNHVGRQAAPGVGRKYAVSKRGQLLAVLLWSHIGLHPRSISRLLGVHISTFVRIRQRVLAILYRLNVQLELPDRQSYQEIDQLVEVYPELLHLG